jgi:hypothetical protein
MSTYEEVRDAMVDILSGREKVTRKPEQWVALQNETALVLARRAGRPLPDQHGLSLASLTPRTRNWLGTCSGTCSDKGSSLWG